MERDRNKMWSVIVSECWVLFLLLSYTQDITTIWGGMRNATHHSRSNPNVTMHVTHFPEMGSPCRSLSFFPEGPCAVWLPSNSASPTVLCGKPLRTGTLPQQSLFLPQYPAHSRSAETLAKLNPVLPSKIVLYIVCLLNKVQELQGSWAHAHLHSSEK